jgi:hypothetical protein
MKALWCFSWPTFRVWFVRPARFLLGNYRLPRSIQSTKYPTFIPAGDRDAALGIAGQVD